MDLKVGEYVRLKHWGISKCIKIENGLYTFDKLDDECWSGDLPNVIYECELEDMVKKHSFNIIDLIEKGDYVNGKKVLDNVSNAFLEVSSSNLGNNRIFARMIKSIVTKELFKLEEYIL